MDGLLITRVSICQDFITKDGFFCKSSLSSALKYRPGESKWETATITA